VIFCSVVLPVKAKEVPGDSLYQIGSLWLRQDEKKIELNELSGKPTILSMVYLSCSFLCPTVISEIQSLESKLDKETKDQVQIVLVSFDPKKDTPQTMRAYAKKRKLDSKHWIFLTNNNESKIRELAAALNFKYQKIEGGDYTHSFMIVLLNEDGVVMARVDGANQAHAPLIEAIKKLSIKK
jgi:protein SCO1/2